jgi:phosphoglucosamine mutase
LLAIDLHERGRLAHDTVVATVMSNLGFVRALRSVGITVHETAVGDRYVLEAMREHGFTLGGEQSGHIIMSDHATTGDGLMVALHVMQRMVRTGRSLRHLAGVVVRLPQVLVNVPGVDRTRTDDPELVAAVAGEQEALGDGGRILLRPSGTEPLVRVMVEAGSAEEASTVADRLADVVRRRLAL